MAKLMMATIRIRGNPGPTGRSRRCSAGQPRYEFGGGAQGSCIVTPLIMLSLLVLPNFLLQAVPALRERSAELTVTGGRWFLSVCYRKAKRYAAKAPYRNNMPASFDLEAKHRRSV